MRLVIFILGLATLAGAQNLPYRVVVTQNNVATTGELCWEIQDKDGVVIQAAQCHNVGVGTPKPDYDAIMQRDLRRKRAQDMSFTSTTQVNEAWPTVSWAQITGKPATYPPEGHAHNANTACSGTDKVSGFDASGAPVCAADQSGSGSLTVLRLMGAAEYTNSTQAYSDVTGSVSSLTMSVTNGATYTFTCDLMVSAAAGATGIQISVNGPSNSFLRYGLEYFTSGTAKATYNATVYDATTGNGTFPINSGAGTITHSRLSGTFTATANGTFAVRARSEVAASAITIYRGSSCMVF